MRLKAGQGGASLPGLIVMAGLLLAMPGQGLAQQSGPVLTPTSPDMIPSAVGALAGGVRLLDMERLLTESQAGRALLDDLEAAERALEAENQSLADDLSREERELTALRPELSPEEFRARADDFDRRVEIIRSERARLAQELAQRYDREAQRFFDAALPVLEELMQDQGITALLRPEAVIIAADWLDVTAMAIERLDRAAEQ